MGTDAGKEKGIRGDDTLAPLHCANVPGIAGVPSPVCLRCPPHPLPLVGALTAHLSGSCAPSICLPSDRPPDALRVPFAGALVVSLLFHNNKAATPRASPPDDMCSCRPRSLRLLSHPPKDGGYTEHINIRKKLPVS